VIESALGSLTKKMMKNDSTSTFKSKDSHDSAYRPEKSTQNRSPSQDRLKSLRESHQIFNFSEYLKKEINDVTDFKRFLT
jgi:hypothetical protein